MVIIRSSNLHNNLNMFCNYFCFHLIIKNVLFCLFNKFVFSVWRRHHNILNNFSSLSGVAVASRYVTLGHHLLFNVLFCYMWQLLLLVKLVFKLRPFSFPSFSSKTMEFSNPSSFSCLFSVILLLKCPVERNFASIIFFLKLFFYWNI